MWKTRFFYVQSLSSEISPKQWIHGSSRALQALRKYSRVLRHWRAPADCFGANPVASALDDPARRDPGEAMRTLPSVLETGPQNRNFLLWRD
jgi:hypothetical protein